jgi:hypothetical protein
MEYDKYSINSLIDDGNYDEVINHLENIKKENASAKSMFLCYAVNRKQFKLVKLFISNGLTLERNDELFLRFYFKDNFERYINYVRLFKVKQYD